MRTFEVIKRYPLREADMTGRAARGPNRTERVVYPFEAMDAGDAFEFGQDVAPENVYKAALAYTKRQAKRGIAVRFYTSHQGRYCRRIE